ncbi:MAG: hypothetical protein ACFFA8_02885 [Promethearchaeota archaeon]
MSRLGRIISISFFYVMLAFILVIFLYNQVFAIILAAFILVIYLVSYLTSLSFKKRLIKTLKNYSLLNDNEIARKIRRPLEDVRSILFTLAKNQKRKKWLIVFINKRYVFYNGETVEKFTELYSMGFNEKQILQTLQKNIRIKTRAEIKAIETTLMNQKRLKE